MSKNSKGVATMSRLRLLANVFGQGKRTISTRNLSRAPCGLEQFCHMSLSLYKVGELRFLTGETLANCYNHFSDSSQAAASLCCRARSQPLRDFIDISALIAEFGTPEVADQMSVVTSSRSNPARVEERCVQCLRLAEKDIPHFSVNDLCICLQSVAWWPADSYRSEAARVMLRSLDSTCLGKLISQQLTTEEQFRLAYLWQSLVCQPSNIQYPTQLLSFMSSFILKSPLTSLVSYLLLLASLRELPNQRPNCPHICDKIKPNFKILCETELLCAYMGLRRLEDCDQRDDLYQYLEQRIISLQN